MLREASDVAIEWDRIGQPAFDRYVEALLHRMFDDSGQVIVVNGRGGDDGIDVQVTTDAGLRIFQLKYHPDGFPGSLKGRRASIKKSFNRALAHNPVEWTLVVPCTLTRSERAFVDKLADGQAVKVSVLDRSNLDCHFAGHADLEASFTRDLLREAAKDFNQEKAMLLGADDLVDRVRALGGRADTVDPDWTWDFQRRGNTVIQTLRAKHSRAHEVSPISLSLVGRPGAMSADLTAAVTRTLGFGIAEDVVLPSEAVECLTIDGPSWLSRTVTDVEVLWRPAPTSAPVGTPIEVAFLDADDGVAARYTGQLKTVGSGGLGASVDTEIHGARLQMMKGRPAPRQRHELPALPRRHSRRRPSPGSHPPGAGWLHRPQVAGCHDRQAVQRADSGCRRKVAGRSACRRWSGMRLGQCAVTASLAKVSRSLPGRMYT
jgi:hypothetical protein